MPNPKVIFTRLHLDKKELCFGKFDQKTQIVGLNWVTFHSYIISSMQNSIIMFTLPLMRSEVLFFGKSEPKNQYCHIKLKFGTSTNWNIKNWRVIITLSM